jgi:hypothetical protein
MVCGSVYVWELGGAEALSNDKHAPPTTCLPVSMYTTQGTTWDIHSDDGIYTVNFNSSTSSAA